MIRKMLLISPKNPSVRYRFPFFIVPRSRKNTQNAYTDTSRSRRIWVIRTAYRMSSAL